MQTQSARTAAASRPRGRRKQLFIDPAFQWRFAALVTACVFVIALLTSIVLYGLLYEQARARTLYLAPASAWSSTLSIVGFAGGFAITVGAAFGLWSVIASQRVCGPLLVMRSYLNELAIGRIPEMRDLRKGDEFQDVYAALRAAVNRLAAERRTAQADLAEALVLIRTIENGAETVRAQALAALRAHVESLHAQAGGDSNTPSHMYASLGALHAPAPNAPAAARELVGAGAD